MAKDKKSVIVYVDWISTFKKLEDAEAGRLIKHFFEYVNDLNPEPIDRLTELLFEPIKVILKRDLIKYESIRVKNKENADKRWQEYNATASDRIKTDANYADNDNDNDNGIDIKEKEEEHVCAEKFNFKKSLISLGVDAGVVSDWLVVRKNKKAANTETAFKRIETQIKLTSVSPTDCIRIATEKSWAGFEADWLKNVKLESIRGRNGSNGRLSL